MPATKELLPRLPEMAFLLRLPLLIGLAALLAACSEEPNSTGIGIIPDSLVITTVSTRSTADSTYIERIGGNLTTLMTGKTAGYESRSILEFSVASFDSTFRLDSAFIRLQPNYRLPDSGRLEFAAHPMVAEWNEFTFRWDSIPGSFDPVASGSFAAAVGPSDTILRMPVDTGLVRMWIDSGKGSVMFVPGSADMIAGFESHRQAFVGTQPVLEINYTDTLDSAQVMSRNAIRGVFVADGMVPVSPGRTFAQGGIAYRTYLRFDSLSLPPRVSVTEALFEFTPDTMASLLGDFSRDSLSVSLSQDWVTPLDSLILTVVCAPVYDGQVKRYRGDVKSYVQLWNTREENLGVVVRAYGETSTFDLFALYGTSAADTLRPRIAITYTSFP